MTQNRFYEERLLVWVFQPAPECPLSYSDLLVYSHLAYQARYDNQPSKRRTAFATGLSRTTVSDALDRLTDYGVYDGEFVRPNPDIFITIKKENRDRPHWSQALAGWRCLVRADKSPLEVPDVMVYSYLLAKVFQQFVPKEGWTASYLAKCLRIERRTVQTCIQRLSKLDLLRVIDGEWLVADALVGVQVDWFKMRQKQKHPSRMGLGTFTPNPRFDPDDVLV